MPGEAEGGPLLDLRLATCLAGNLHQLLSVALLRLGPATTTPGHRSCPWLVAKAHPQTGAVTWQGLPVQALALQTPP